MAQAVDADGVGAGYFASDNVEYVGYVPLENDRGIDIIRVNSGS